MLTQLRSWTLALSALALLALSGPADAGLGYSAGAGVTARQTSAIVYYQIWYRTAPGGQPHEYGTYTDPFKAKKVAQLLKAEFPSFEVWITRIGA